MRVTEREREKYRALWSLPQYHEMSPGLAMVEPFLAIAKPEPGSSILDVGCGAGAASRALKDKGHVVAGFDLARDGWEHADIPLFDGSIWRDLPLTPLIYRHVFCCDVLEHIPTEFVALSVANAVASASVSAFFSISFQPDNFGAFVRVPLHLTVRPFEWWRDLFREVALLVDARDLMGEGIFLAGSRGVR